MLIIIATIIFSVSYSALSERIVVKVPAPAINGNARGKWRLETYREGTHDTDSVRMTQKKQTLLHGYSLLSRIDTQTDTHTHTHAQNTTISTSSVVEREAEEAV